tara:strand:+ start:2493 stop:3887 length:1395 start_codon:yes stop_codon:yes gene_type:complete
MPNNTAKKIFFYFLISHLIIWTLVPSLANNNLPRDTIEALAWGSDLQWGFDKHPPLSAFAVEVFYKIFGKQDWAYYFLSQIFIVSTFFIIWKFSEDFFQNKNFSLISVLILEGIFFYNFTTPEFNVNVAQIPFWALSVYYLWKCIKYDKAIDYLFLGLFIGLGILSKYLFIYLVLAIKLVFIYMIKKGKKIKLSHYFIAGPVTLLILLPHLIWLTENNYITITYGLHRSADIFYAGEPRFLNHLKYPAVFLFKQILLMIPFFLMILFVVNKFKIKFNFKDKKTAFLIAINIIPFVLVFLTSLFFGINIRTMWMTPFYLFYGVMVIYILQKYINLKKINLFYSVFLFLFIISPSLYLFNSVAKKDQRIDYPAKEVALEVKKNWNRTFKNDIDFVVGEAWWAGNLSYHLDSRPKFIRGYLNFVKKEIRPDQGIVYIESESSKLTKKCPGEFFIIQSRYVCMVGVNK